MDVRCAAFDTRISLVLTPAASATRHNPAPAVTTELSRTRTLRVCQVGEILRSTGADHHTSSKWHRVDDFTHTPSSDPVLSGLSGRLSMEASARARWLFPRAEGGEPRPARLCETMRLDHVGRSPVELIVRASSPMPLLNPPPPRRASPGQLDLHQLSTLEPFRHDDRPLRIALVTEYYYPHLGGICEHVHFLAREARRRGHHVDIVTSHIPGASEQPNVIRVGRSQPIYSNGSQARITLGWGLRRQMRRVLRDGRYDIVHAHSPLTPVLPLLAIEEAACPVVGTFHTYFDRSFAYRLGRRFFQRRLETLGAAIAVSNSTTVALRRYFDADWKVIPNGIDTDVFNPGAPQPPQLSRDVPTILFLGRFDPRNGLATLIESFRLIKGRGSGRRRARLVVVGDGPLRNHYHRQAKGDPDIIFVGPVLERRPSYYAHSSVYACPTTKASFGITLLEAMACETPVVCSDILGFRDVVANEREALMVRCGDRDALADALVRVLDDGALATRLGTRGRLTALEYSWATVASRVLDVYHAVLGTAAAEARPLRTAWR